MRSVAAIYVPRDLTVTICFLTAPSERASERRVRPAVARAGGVHLLATPPPFDVSPFCVFANHHPRLGVEWNETEQRNGMERNGRFGGFFAQERIWALHRRRRGRGSLSG